MYARPWTVVPQLDETTTHRDISDQRNCRNLDETGQALRHPGGLSWRGFGKAPRRAAAEVCGVGHPVAGGGFLPLDGGVDVDPEHAGEDRGGELGGEGEQGCGADLTRVQADVLEPVSKASA